MNKTILGLLFVCLILNNVEGYRVVNKKNLETTINMALKFAETFFAKYGTLNLKNMNQLHHFGDLKYQNLKLTLTPKDPTEEEPSIYEGKLIVEGLTFNIANVYYTPGQEDEQVDISMPLLQVSFNLYSNNSFVSIDEVEFNEENELYAEHAQTFKSLVNMAIIKSLGPVYHTLANENIDTNSLASIWLNAFDQYLTEYYGERKTENSPFIFDVSKYLNRKDKQAEKEIVIDNPEDLQTLSVNFNVGQVHAKPEGSKTSDL